MLLSLPFTQPFLRVARISQNWAEYYSAYSLPLLATYLLMRCSCCWMFPPTPWSLSNFWSWSDLEVTHFLIVSGLGRPRRNSAPHPVYFIGYCHIVPEVQLPHPQWTCGSRDWLELCCDCAQGSCSTARCRRNITPTIPQQLNHLWADSIQQRLSLVLRFSSPRFKGEAI